MPIVFVGMVKRATAAVLAVLFLTPAIFAQTDSWQIDPAHSNVTFTVTKFGFVDVEARFLKFNGTITYDPANVGRSKIDWRIKVASVESGERNRDESMQGPDYFDAARFPELTFTSTTVKAAGHNVLDVTGTITIRGVSKPLTIQARYGGKHAVAQQGTFEIFHTDFTVNRRDFGITAGTYYSPLISNEVRITLTAASRSPQ